MGEGQWAHGKTITWGVEDKKKTNSARGFCIYYRLKN